MKKNILRNAIMAVSLSVMPFTSFSSSLVEDEKEETFVIKIHGSDRDGNECHFYSDYVTALRWVEWFEESIQYEGSMIDISCYKGSQEEVYRRIQLIDGF